MSDTALSHRTAIVAVHGVQPHPRYEIQDACANNLASQLKSAKRFGQSDWVVDIVQPQATAGSQPLPTISRVHVAGDADGTIYPFFDVTEAYWSPLDKGLTNIQKVLTWLLRSLFVPLNTTVKYSATPGKTLYDIGFILGAAALAMSALIGSLILAVTTANRVLLAQCTQKICATDSVVDFWKSWQANLTPQTLGILLATAVGAFLAAQALKALYGWFAQLLKPAPVQRGWRIFLILSIGSAGVLLIWIAMRYSVIHPQGQPLGISALFFVVAAALFLGGRAVLQSFVVNFFSDVQIYTTHDENNTFYKARSDMLKLVSDVIAHMCSDKACNSEPYERVFIFGHSLGSTICMDAITQFYQSCEQGSQPWDAFKRLRGFVTFGTALEKTKYFFDTQNAAVSVMGEQARNDSYGVLFTPVLSDLDLPRTTLNVGIYWANYWYFLDAVSNGIESYRSFLLPGESVSDAQAIRKQVEQAVPASKAYVPRLVCHNEKRGHFFSLPSVIPHGDYLYDDDFWDPKDAAQLGVLDIVARTAKLSATSLNVANRRLQSPHGGGAGPLTATLDGFSFSRNTLNVVHSEDEREARRKPISVLSRVDQVSPREAQRYLDSYNTRVKPAASPTTTRSDGS